MHFDSTAYLITLNAALACAVFGFLCWSWWLSNKLDSVRLSAAETARAAEARVAQLSVTLEELAAENQTQRAIASARMPAASINLTKRSQALAMYRRGDSTDTIATTLALPRADVEFLVKVQKTVVSEGPQRNGKPSLVWNA
jgi:hypothetical protein